MKTRKSVSNIILTIVGGVCVFLGPAVGHCADRFTRSVVGDVKVRSSRNVELNQSQMIVKMPGTKKTVTIPVVLVETVNDVMLKRSDRPSSESPSRSTEICYELSGKSGNFNYSYSVWSWFTCIGFRLFNLEGGLARMAWVSGRNVYVADVSKPNDRKAALINEVNDRKSPGITRFSVVDLIGEKPFEGLNALHLAIDIESMTKTASGNLMIQISGSSGEKFRLIFSNGQWRMADWCVYTYADPPVSGVFDTLVDFPQPPMPSRDWQ